MFKFLLKSKKGFTIVELVIVLLLLSFGVLALANMFRVTYRAFSKAEERYIKQEAVKEVAETLRKGQTNVASALSADIFDTRQILPTKSADITYSYLYFDPHTICSVCEGEWDTENNRCPSACVDATSKVDGYFLKCMNRGQTQQQAIQLSDVPIYVSFEPMRDFEVTATEEERKNENNKVNQCGVIITLAALEDDYKYEDGDGDGLIDPPISDDIYYSLDVAYHFPNMVLSESGITVNYTAEKKISRANLYLTDGTTSGTVEAVNVGGVILRVYSDSIISGDTSNSQLSTPALCFIATASYGQDSGEVGLLCKFRDECLLTNPLGTAFVKAYYKLSPPIADFIRDSEPLKAVVRVALKPLVMIATNAVDEDVATENAPWFIMFMICGAGATATLIKVDKRRKKAKE